MNEEQLNTLLNALDQRLAPRFDAIDKQFENFDKRFDDLEDQFASLYRYIEQKFSELEKKLDGKADKAQLDHFISLLDKDLKERELDEQERLAANAQIRRLTDRVRVLEAKAA